MSVYLHACEVYAFYALYAVYLSQPLGGTLSSTHVLLLARCTVREL